MKNTTYSPDLIIDEVKNYIHASVVNSEEHPRFESFHKSILKKYFDAKNIKINYTAQTITLDLPMSNKNYTAITFECLDLSSFLSSLVKNDEQSLFFYQSLLSNHKVTTAA